MICLPNLLSRSVQYFLSRAALAEFTGEAGDSHQPKPGKATAKGLFEAIRLATIAMPKKTAPQPVAQPVAATTAPGAQPVAVKHLRPGCSSLSLHLFAGPDRPTSRDRSQLRVDNHHITFHRACEQRISPGMSPEAAQGCRPPRAGIL